MYFIQKILQILNGKMILKITFSNWQFLLPVTNELTQLNPGIQSSAICLADAWIQSGYILGGTTAVGGKYQ